MFQCFRVELLCGDRCVRADATTVSAAEHAKACAAAAHNVEARATTTGTAGTGAAGTGTSDSGT